MNNIIQLVVSIISGKISLSFLRSLLPLFSKQAQLLISKILPQALLIVADLATKNQLTNKQKQKAAFDKLTKIVKAEGIEVGNSLLNLVIELAVTQIKK